MTPWSTELKASQSSSPIPIREAGLYEVSTVRIDILDDDQ
jgi:hypothetical protein